MLGELRGDFSRITFNPAKHFSQVLMQQGRVQLDADWNEQTAILLHYLRTLATDLLGPHAGTGFDITFDKDTKALSIGAGHYYVDGILCENEERRSENGELILLSYLAQEDYPIKNHPNQDDIKLPDLPFLVYLDVWERHISYLEDDSIREVALGGADTTTRSKVVWQVKVNPLESGTNLNDIKPNWDELKQQWQPKNRGLLKARNKPKDSTSTSPCITSPESRYRGTENQLYRVEIHKGGKAGEATFKWSRDNGAIAVGWLDQKSNDRLIISSSGRDGILGMSSGQWVELTDDTHELLGIPGTLVKLVKVESQTLTIDLTTATGSTERKRFPNNPKIRRWDHLSRDVKDLNKSGVKLGDDNAILIQEKNDKDEQWFTLEDGVQIQFQPEATYRTGDYWLIPARTATGEIEWIYENNDLTRPKALPPHGIEHHYAPLAIVLTDKVEPCRRVINSITSEVKNE